MGNKTKIKTKKRLPPKGFKKNDKGSRFNRIKTKNEEWTNKSEFDRITFLRNEFDNSPSLKKCHKFIQVLSKKFDVKFNLNNHGLIYRRCDGKSEKETCEMGIVYSFQNENGCIMFRPHTTTSIELFDFQINLNEKKNLMNRLSKKYDKSISQISLNWLISHENVFVIPKASKKNHIELNATSSDFEMDSIDIKMISDVFSVKPYYINPRKIKVSLSGEGNRKVYETIEEAIENKLNMQPSPVDLSNFIINGDPVKPVRVIPSTSDDHYEYELIEGRLRFWAWNIAYNGERDVPCIMR